MNMQVPLLRRRRLGRRLQGHDYIKTTLARAAANSSVAVHLRGRASTKSIYISQWLRFTAVQVDSSMSYRCRKQLLSDIAAYHTLNDGVVFLLGDWNFLHPDEARLLSSGEELRPSTALASHFEDMFKDYIERRQQTPTFRRLARASGDAAFFSRIDRIYTNIHPTTLANLHIGVWIREGIAGNDCPSDRRLVEVFIRERRRRSPVRLKAHVTGHHMFGQLLEEEMTVYRGVADPDVRYHATIQAARATQKRILPIACAGQDPPPQALADTCVRVFTLICIGR